MNQMDPQERTWQEDMGKVIGQARTKILNPDYQSGHPGQAIHVSKEDLQNIAKQGCSPLVPKAPHDEPEVRHAMSLLEKEICCLEETAGHMDTRLEEAGVLSACESDEGKTPPVLYPPAGCPLAQRIHACRLGVTVARNRLMRMMQRLEV